LLKWSKKNTFYLTVFKFSEGFSKTGGTSGV